MQPRSKRCLRRLTTLLALPLASAALLALPAASQAAEATATLTPSPQAFPSLTVGERSSQQQFVFQNAGPEPLSVEGVSISGTGASDFSLESNSCSGALLFSGESCLLYVSFAPNATGLHEAALEVSHNGENSPVSAILTGSGLSQELTLSPSPLTLPMVTVGNSSEKQVTVANKSEAGVNISSVQIEGAGAGAFNTNGSNCGFLSVGNSCTITIRFSPGSAGEQRAVLHIHSEGTPGDQFDELIGVGAAPQLRFEPESFDFGLTPIKEGNRETTMQLRNVGAASVQVSLEMVDNGSNAFFISNSNCFGAILAPNETCSLQVDFNPNQTGLFVSQVRAGNNGTFFTAEIRGTGGQAEISGSPNPASFGETAVGSTSATRTITMTNSGDLPGGFFIVILSGGDIGSFQVLEEDCTGTPLSPGASCAARVRFQPTSPGLKRAQLSFIGDGEGIVQVNLSGEGVCASNLVLSPNAHNFGNQVVNTTGPTQLFTFTNSTAGSAAFSGATFTGSNPDQFRLSSDSCLEAALAPGESCQVGVRFGPDSAGAKTAFLRLSGSAGSLSASLSGNGEEGPPPAPKLNFRSSPRPLHPSGSTLKVGSIECKSVQSCAVKASATIASSAPRGSSGHGKSTQLSPLQLTVKESASKTLNLRLTGTAQRLLASNGGQLRLQLHWSSAGHSGQSSSSAAIR